MRDLEPGARLSVEDDGALVPLPAVAPPPLESQGMTGRGLAIVSVLAESWGIEERADGRRIWAELTGDGVEHDLRPPTVEVGEQAMPEPTVLPADWVTVRLPAVRSTSGSRSTSASTIWCASSS